MSHHLRWVACPDYFSTADAFADDGLFDLALGGGKLWESGQVGIAKTAKNATSRLTETGSEVMNSGTALLEAALTRENMVKAWKRVKANKGSAGVDGMTIRDAVDYLKSHWLRIKESLLDGTYRPAPVRRVMIPKSDGTERQLGIPTVLDRVIQQALLQVLQPQIDPTFSEHSYGFRPKRSAHQAVLKAQEYVQSGRVFVVDVDLEKFFDRVNHDVLMSRLEKRIGDQRVLRLIRRYLQAGILADGITVDRHEGTPQGRFRHPGRNLPYRGIRRRPVGPRELPAGSGDRVAARLRDDSNRES